MAFLGGGDDDVPGGSDGEKAAVPASRNKVTPAAAAAQLAANLAAKGATPSKAVAIKQETVSPVKSDAAPAASAAGSGSAPGGSPGGSHPGGGEGADVADAQQRGRGRPELPILEVVKVHRQPLHRERGFVHARHPSLPQTWTVPHLCMASG